MTKWIVIISLLVFLIMMIALRYRQQLQAALQIWRMFRQFKQVSKTAEKAEKKVETKEIDKNTPLVRCAKCGKWISQTDALDLRSKTFYCSTVCMEKAARIESLVDRI